MVKTLYARPSRLIMVRDNPSEILFKEVLMLTHIFSKTLSSGSCPGWMGYVGPTYARYT